MGYLLIIIGLLNLSIIARINKGDYPPISASVILILMLAGVIYAGVNYFSSWQVYGGTIGILLQSICLIFNSTHHNGIDFCQSKQFRTDTPF